MKKTRRCKPILRVKPHVMYVWKEHVASAYFHSLRVRCDMLSVDEARKFLEKMGYVISVNCFPSIVLGVETLLVVVGAGDRVEKPRSVGELSVVNCTLGHVALVSSFIRFSWRCARVCETPTVGWGKRYTRSCWKSSCG